jgi:16S rRNA (uracil1498-N3)-methyltransferase
MSQYLVRPEDITPHQFTLRDREARHLIQVLRAEVGDKIDIFDGHGRRFLARIEQIDADQFFVEGTILEPYPASSKKSRISLYQGLPRGSKFDFVIEKATELGVDAIIPYFSQKNPVKLSKEEGINKQIRWQRVAVSAAKQSNRADVPAVDLPKSWDSFLDSLKGSLNLLLEGPSGRRDLGKIFKEKPSELNQVNIIVGPESGFAKDEAARLHALGVIPVSLGTSTLRTETAGLAALAITAYELDLK